MRFTKMQGVGNDFVVVAGRDLPRGVSLPELAIQTCDRKFGIGADGLLVVLSDVTRRTAFKMRMFNPDGSEDMCGNGLRCVSLWAHGKAWMGDQTEFTVAAMDGPRKVELLSVSENGRTAEFRVDMGVPLFAPKSLPFCGEGEAAIVSYPLAVDGEDVVITAVNTGSTHTVIFGPPPDEEVFQRVSPLIENHPLFPERTSVLWATPRKPDTHDIRIFDIRIWERGAGETLGCGTGACAVGVAAVLSQYSEPNIPIDIISKGGTLRITWPGEGASVFMAGPAQFVYEGDIALDRAA